MEWRIDSGFIDYEGSLALMQRRVQLVIRGLDDELVWMLQYKPLYTGGTSSDASELINSDLFPVFHVGRGGKYTYHGPGQRVVYLILNLKKRNMCDLRRYIHLLEEVVILVLGSFGINGYRRDNYIGVWVKDEGGQWKKIAAIGVRISKWVSYHGIAVNLYPNLSHYNSIVPCGIKNAGVTSVKEMGVEIKDFNAFDEFFQEAFVRIFGK